MYLAKLSMDIHHPSIRQALKDRQDMHRNLAQIYSSEFLYRIIKTNKSIDILILCMQPPNKTKLEHLGYYQEAIQDLSLLPQLYKKGSVMRFSLLTSPSKKAKEKPIGKLLSYGVHS